MKLKLLIFSVIVFGVIACSQKDAGSGAEADMYEASELAALMRDMVEFSKDAKAKLASGETIDSIPAHFWDLKTAEATRDEHLETPFQTMTEPYLKALEGIQRGDSQQYYYNASIQACKSCHGVYCGGPMSIINQL
jgi:hypothetical protein